MGNILPILIADAPEALTELCGVNLLERLLRILQRLGFRSAIVFSTTPEIVGPELEKPSWAREQVTADVVPRANESLTAQLLLEQIPSDRFLIIPGNIYCDARLLAETIPGRTCRFRSARIRAIFKPKSIWAGVGRERFSLFAFAYCALLSTAQGEDRQS